MKRYSLFIMALSVMGAGVSSMLLHQHYFPHAEFSAAVCGSGLDNPCALLSRSGYSVLFGLPVAGYGLIGYLLLIITALLAIIADDSWHKYCLAFQMPVAAAFVLTDIALGSILIYLKLSCRLCMASYVINILICITLFVWYLYTREEGEGLQSLYRGLIAFIRDRNNRPVVAAFSFATLFMILTVFYASAFLEASGSKSEPSAVEMRKFEEHYYSLREEDISLPESAMSLGPASAPVRIIVFTDFICSACGKFYDIEHYLLSRFPGKIRVDYYSFPLDTVCNSHVPKTVYSNSCVAAQAFSAAARMGIFRDFINYHYGNYRANASRLKSGDVMAGFKEYFREHSTGDRLGVFLKEAMSDEARSSVHDSIELGGALRVRAVPTIFINGRRLEGVPEAKLIEHVLAREIGEQ